MKRRSFFRTLVSAPAASALLAQQQPQAAPGLPGRQTVEPPKLEATATDQAGDPVPRFFNAQQFAALSKVSEMLMPPLNGAPGAVEARVPEFLDFLIGESQADRQQVYGAGLDALNAESKRRFNKPFAEIGAGEADMLLAPLRAPWTYDPPSDPLANFLVTAKQDVRTATMNSREWNSAGGAAGGRRGFGGTGLYWNPI